MVPRPEQSICLAEADVKSNPLTHLKCGFGTLGKSENCAQIMPFCNLRMARDISFRAGSCCRKSLSFSAVRREFGVNR